MLLTQTKRALIIRLPVLEDPNRWKFALISIFASLFRDNFKNIKEN